MRAFVPILLLIISIVGGYAIVNPMYQEVKSLNADASQYRQAISKGKEFESKISSLTAQREALAFEDIERLEKMIPDNIDNVRLIIEIDSLAKKYSNGIKNIRVGDLKANTNTNDRNRRVDTNVYETISLGFSVSMTYDQFVLFLKDLESNLRLSDVTTLSFIPIDTSNVYEFNLNVKTYWLKSQ
jgi:Tfp pilus assembly protein PilO